MNKTLGINKWIAAFLVLCLISCGPESNRTETNAENLEKVSKGMGLNEVISIMGKPEEMHDTPLNDSTTELVYSSPIGMSDHYRIRISKNDSIVVYVGDGL